MVSNNKYSICNSSSFHILGPECEKAASLLEKLHFIVVPLGVLRELKTRILSRE